MTQMQVQPMFPPTWPLEELYSYLISNLNLGDVQDTVEVQDEIGETMTEEALVALDVMEKGAGLGPGTPKARLAFYYTMPNTAQDSLLRLQQTMMANQNAIALGQPQQPLPIDLSWEEYRAKFPEEAEASWQDFQKLRALDAEGKLKS